MKKNLSIVTLLFVSTLAYGQPGTTIPTKGPCDSPKLSEADRTKCRAKAAAKNPHVSVENEKKGTSTTGPQTGTATTGPASMPIQTGPASSPNQTK